MIVNKQKTYAWINATAVSRTVIKNVIANGNKLPNASAPPAISIFQIKLAKIVNNKWPAVIFAARRSPNEIGLAKYEIISTATKKPAIGAATPGGKNIEK